MTYIILATIFFLTLIAGFINGIGLLFKKNKFKKYNKIYIAWLSIYTLFIIFGTGPSLNRARIQKNSPYKLPWQEGVEHFVSQGNKSFTSHRDLHLYAWDFWMPIGTKILASRSGKVIKVIDHFDGIGIESNLIKIEHLDKSKALYAHIKKHGSLVKEGDNILQGQVIALSGMVGQTINPHLHFVVFNKDETESIPISFSDVDGGVPLAGHFYTSQNKKN